MPEISPPKSPKPKRRWLRRALYAALGLLLLVAIFHRPLFHFVLRTAAIQIAARQHLRLDLHTSGSIFTNLVIDGVRVSPTGDGPTPVKKIAIEHLRFDYSLPLLVKKGVGEFLRSYEVRDAHLDLVALPSGSEKERKEKVAVAEQLNNILAQPAAYADRARIEDFNITVTATDSVTRVEGFHLVLDPEKAGYLRIARLDVPGVPVWENLHATTSYEKRNLFIKDLRLAPELVIDEVNFDASQRAQNTGSMLLKAHAFGGTLEVSLRGSELQKKGRNLPKGYSTEFAATVEHLAITRAADYFGVPRPPAATLDRFAMHFTGEPEEPRTWQGDVAARVEELAPAPAFKVDSVELSAAFENGTMTVQRVHAMAGKNAVDVAAVIHLPESVEDFAKSDVDATLKIDAHDLAALSPPLSGGVAGDGKVTLRGGALAVALNVNADSIASADIDVGAARIAVHATKHIDAPGLEQLDGRVSAEVSGIRFQTVTIDSAALDAAVRDDLVNLHKAEVRRRGNTISAAGTYRIDPTKALNTPADMQFTIDAPALDAFGVSANGATLAGRLAGHGALKLSEGAPAGELVLDGGEFEFGDFHAERLAAKIHVVDDTASIEQLALQINATDQLAIVGKVGIAKPFAYEGTLFFGVKNLAIFQPLLELFGAKEAPPEERPSPRAAPPEDGGAPLGGALDAQWAGSGAIEPQTHEGKLSISLDDARYGTFEKIALRLAALYGPGFAESSEFRAALGPTSLAGAIEWREGRLRLRDIDLQQEKSSVLTGYVLAPFDPANLKAPVPLDGRIAVNLNATSLDIEKLLASFGQTSPASGNVTANLIAGGTPLKPFVHVRVAGRALKAKAVPQLDAAGLDFNLHYANKDLTVEAVLRQPQIQPLTVKGHAPLDLAAVISEKKIDPALPIEASVKLPPSSLAFVTKLTPQVARIDGTAAVDVKVGGTVGKPDISGSANVVLKGARIANENVPAINSFEASLGFAGDTLNLNKFRGEIGGGTFKVAGNIKLAELANPVFDLRIESRDVLAKRDDTVTIRADTDLKIAGPLNAGTASGTVYLTHSRFFKEIDILPIGLPGRPAPPTPKSAPAVAGAVSFPDPPLRDWTFDIAILTRDDDPFRIRGNLANGSVSLNLRLGGTGLEPWLEGAARIDKFTGSLPFSTISITRGFVYFKKDEPFQPSLDIQAESKTRDYTVSAYIYGKVTDPQVQLSSEPPLSNGDIVSLLATGVTTSELAGSAEVLASRAAILAVQSLYRKIFKRGATAAESKPADPGSIRDRFQVELGAVDNRSGQREITSRFKINDNFFIVGDLDTGGGFTGQLKYLIRFR